MDWYQITLIIGAVLVYLGFKIGTDHNSGPLDMLVKLVVMGAGAIAAVVGGIGWIAS